MLFPSPLLEITIALLLLGLAGRFLYVRFLHPAWRRKRFVIRACEKAFGEGDYELVRFRVVPKEPSFWDLFPRPFGLSEVPRYFTYKVQAVGETEPDFSGLSSEESSLVRRYIRREAASVPHHGRDVLRSEWEEEPVTESRQTQEAENDLRRSVA